MTSSTEQWDTVSHATPEQVAFFRDQGYLKFGRIFTPGEMAELKTHVDEMIEALPAGKRPEEMDVPHFNDPWLFRYLAHPRVLDVIQDFIGPDIALWSSHFIAKPKGNGKLVPWHTDGAYWGKALQPMNVITLWLAVDESNLENGCMRVIPGSHHDVSALVEQYVPVDTTDNVFHLQLKPEMMDEAKAVDLELKVGECHFHDAWTVHGSNRNLSDKRRCGFTMRYMPSNVHYTGSNFRDSHAVYLLRGEDRSGGKNDYRPIPAH